MPKAKLTDASVRRLKALDGQTDYFDAAYPGLALRVTPKGVRSWVYFGRVHGKVKRATLGRYPNLSLMDARRKAGEVAGEMRAGIDPAAAKRASRTDVPNTVSEIAALWLKRDQAKNRSVREVERVLERLVLPLWGYRVIDSITRPEVAELIDNIADRTPIMARRVHAHLHRMFRWAVGRGLISANPMADLPKPAAEVKRDRVLSDSELVLFWRAATETPWPFGPLMKLLALTGARREEITGLRWNEIDLGAAEIRLESDRTKSGEARTIPLSPTAVAIIEDLPRVSGSDLCFTTTGQTPVSGWSRAKRIVDAKIAELNNSEPIPPWTIHDLRRVVATGLQRLGQNLQVIEAVLGHVTGSRSGVIGTYQRHSFDPEKRAGLDKWAAHVHELVTGETSKVVAFPGA